MWIKKVEIEEAQEQPKIRIRVPCHKSDNELGDIWTNCKCVCKKCGQIYYKDRFPMDYALIAKGNSYGRK